ncbi:MAG TPA: isoprenylcysteine carboxylmethyltransferase family protein [Terriglobales bacterium]|jgi:protein-S-isoprenylcysteine O-methyltransferase Ste14|nr:isoprenylcysteine carboxylmethyltransferase family protein [Terriglobales bacterium]
MAKQAAAPQRDSSGSWLGALASLIVGAGFLALWFWLLPPWLGFQGGATGLARWRWLGVIPAIVGFGVMLRCIWNFGWTGRGTPAPMAPPQRLVVVGFYRYVRNPMYVGFLMGWAGLWIIFGRMNQGSITVAVIFLLCVMGVVRFYEEPVLRRMFGAEYEEYCRNVPRWMPRLRPWIQP